MIYTYFRFYIFKFTKLIAIATFQSNIKGTVNLFEQMPSPSVSKNHTPFSYCCLSASEGGYSMCLIQTEASSQQINV